MQKTVTGNYYYYYCYHIHHHHFKHIDRISNVVNFNYIQILRKISIFQSKELL